MKRIVVRDEACAIEAYARLIKRTVTSQKVCVYCDGIIGRCQNLKKQVPCHKYRKEDSAER